MKRIIWSGTALKRLQAAYYFLLEYDEEAAKAAVLQIKKAVAGLATAPHCGRPVLEVPSADVRELVVHYGASGYVVLYQVEETRILIMTLRHQRELGYK